MIKVVIIEDEKPAADKLQRMLLQADESVEIVGIIKSVSEALEWFELNEIPDLITMDVQLADGTCFDIFSKIDIDVPVIFTTAYDEYALKAFKVNSVDYLLKPIGQSELEKALLKFEKMSFNWMNQQNRVREVGKALNRKQRYLVKAGSTYHSVSVNDVEYFYISERSTFIKTFKGKHFGIDESLEKINDELDSSNFFRINRNYIINIEAISKMVSISSSRLKILLKSGERNHNLIVSRDKVGDFKNWMGG